MSPNAGSRGADRAGAWRLAFLASVGLAIVSCGSPSGEVSCLTNADCPSTEHCIGGRCETSSETRDAGADASSDAFTATADAFTAPGDAFTAPGDAFTAADDAFTGPDAAPECTLTECTCEPGHANCDGSVATGCETDTTSTYESCGACGASCTLRGTDRECRASTCETVGCSSGFTDCSAAVAGCEAYMATDRNNCGTCGHVCAVGELCSNGACCPIGFDFCAGSCVNMASDRAHCGECGHACALGLRCFDYECVP